VFAQYLRFPLFPQTNEMLFALALLLSDDITAQLIEFLMVIVTAVALCSWGQRAFSLRAGLWAAGLWLSNPMVVLLGGSALIDPGLAHFGCLATYAFFTWASGKQTSWLVVAGVFSGLAAGTKHTALILIGMLAVITVFLAVRDRRWTYPVIYVALAVGIPAFWYLRSLYFSGNPVEPLLPQVFGYSLWNEADWQIQIADWTRRGTGKDLGSLLLLPWNLATRQPLFGSDPPLNTVIYFALPLSLYWAVRSSYVRGLLALVVLYYAIWFYNAQIQRYLMVMLPAFMLLTAASLSYTLPRIPFLRRRSPHAVVTVLGVVLAIAPGWLYALNRVATKGPVPTMQAERDAYLAQSLPAYRAHQWLNAQRGSDYRLYGLMDEDMAYFTDGTHIGNTLGVGRFNDIIDRTGTGQDLYDALAVFDVDYFLVTAHRRQIELPDDDSFRSHFRSVFQIDEAEVFEVIK
jgi:4-amino-4-deoxy-L-arabinose transferase-like glycosyltransferase